MDDTTYSLIAALANRVQSETPDATKIEIHVQDDEYAAFVFDAEGNSIRTITRTVIDRG